MQAIYTGGGHFMTERFHFIDWAKSIAIVCICVGHFLPRGSSVKIFLYTFHVPIFFIISGFLSYRESYRFSLDHIKKFSLRVLIPYTVWFWLSAIPQVFFLNNTWPHCVSRFLFLNGKTLWNYPLWFMPCFYIVFILHYICVVFFAKNHPARHLFLSFAGLCAACYLDNRNINFMLFGLNKCAMMLGFQFLGSGIRLLYQKQPQSIIKYHRLGFLLFWGAGILSCMINKGDNLSIMNADFNNVYAFVILSSIMSISFFWSCMALPRVNLVSLLSQNTIPLMCAHYFLRPLLYPYLSPEQFLYITTGIWVSIFYFFCVIIIRKISAFSPKLTLFFSIFGFQL